MTKEEDTRVDGSSTEAGPALCAAVHGGTGAVCELPSGHAQNHRGIFDNGIAQWPRALALDAELAALREVAQIATDTLQTVDEWLGMASTRQAATDAIWRLTRALQRAGYPVRVHDDLRWRGSIIRACEQAGIGLGEDHVTMRVRLDTDQPWQHASGPVLTPDKVRRVSSKEY